jgi:hypothetical protein
MKKSDAISIMVSDDGKVFIVRSIAKALAPD